MGWPAESGRHYVPWHGARKGHEVNPQGSPEARPLAAAAVRRLGEALAANVVDGAVLARIATEAGALADAAETGERYDKRTDPQMAARWATLREFGRWPDPPADGEVIVFDRASIGGGDANPFSIGARIHRDGDEAVLTVRVRAPYEGPPERVHGGVIAVLVDEAMGSLMRILATVAYTGSLTVRYRTAAPLGEALEFRARLLGREGRKISVACTCRSGGGVFAEAEAVFIEVDPAVLLAE